MSWADCPTGTKLTGGGNENYSSGYTFAEFQDVSTWVVFSDIDPDAVDNDPTDLTAWAVCYNPRGAVPTTSAKAATSAPELSAAVR